MNNDLDTAIRSFLARIDDATPMAPPLSMLDPPTPTFAPRRLVVIAACTGVAAAGITGVITLRPADDAAPRSGSPASDTTTPATIVESSPTTINSAPGTVGATLADSHDVTDVPITVPAGASLEYWRFLPDLDIAYRQTSDVSTELCWRTPAGSGCIADDFMSPHVGIIPTDRGVIVLTGPGLIPIDSPSTDPMAPRFEVGPEPTTVVATLSDGTTTSVAIEHLDDFGLGFARIATPPGTTVVIATSE